MRVGIGYDIHRLVEGRSLVIGGVEIPHTLGLQGHSDADVLLHAICDAMLGAAGCGDLGSHFPDSDPKWKGISSLELLRQTGALVEARGYSVQNVDAVVLAELPRLGPYREQMKAAIASALGIPGTAVNVKATTNEGLGPVGRQEGIAAHAVVLLAEAQAGAR